MKKILLLFAAIILCSQMLFPTDVKKMEINENWKFRQKDSAEWMTASVPGCVHTDLMNNKIIGDPFFGINETKLQWIGERDWVYQTTFNVPDEMLQKKNIEIVFKGLDTYADVYLNDSPLLSADNMFREWRVKCKDQLKNINKLEIHFRNVFDETIPKWISSPFRRLAGENNDQSDTAVALYSRKAQFHYGWDWGPRLVTAGIWRPVIIEAWDDVKINNVFVINQNVTTQKAELSSLLEIESSGEQNAFLQIISENNTLTYQEIRLSGGINNIKLTFSINEPRLWWSNGLGEQHLYHFRFVLKTDAAADEKTVTTGIRSLQLVREKDSLGTSFYVRLNGVPVFMKGANYIPLDNFQNRVTRERYEYLVSSAAEANMNMLRVWGGGIYEEDTFYEMCDKYGILVWQDFMFACSMYPGDEHFLESVRNEVIDNIKRIRNHPSIALYCGNNENQVGWYTWGWKPRYSTEHQAQYEKEMNSLFLEVIPQALKETDPTRFYNFSSPSAGFLNYNYMDGDIHYWGVWHGKDPFEDYGKHIARFVSEYGFQSYPIMNSIKKFTEPADRNLDSEAMLSHQRCMADGRRDKRLGNRLIKTYMDRYYEEPKDFESYLYASQLVQAEGMTMAIEAHRRNMPVCMGSLYWQINDCWPVASWSGMDYYGTWKALHYAAKRAFSEIIIAPVSQDDSFDLYAASDRLSNADGIIKIKVTDLKGKEVFEKEFPVVIEANTSRLYLTLNKDELMNGEDPENLVITARLISAGNIAAEKIFYFTVPKELELEKPDIKITANGNSIELTSDILAKNVYLWTENGIQFSDNFFDLLPGEKKVISIKLPHDAGEIQSSLRVMSLIDTF